MNFLALETFSSNPVIQYLELISAFFSVLFFVFLPIELWRRYRAGRLTRHSVRESLFSLSPLTLTMLSSGVVIAFITFLYSAAATLQIWTIPSTIWTAVLALLLVDFLYYWDHRCGHRIGAYWAFSHSVHHSSHQYDQTTATRISFIDGFISPWFYLPAVFIGFDPLLVLGCFGVILAYQQWIHTESIGKLPALDGWLNTPSNHRVHHGVQSQYLDKNYGAILMVWDRIFGTYEPENAPVTFGLTQPIKQSESMRPKAWLRGIWDVHTWEAQVLLRKLRRAKSWRARWNLLWRPPNEIFNVLGCVAKRSRNQPGQ